jgi:hypothetical protein
MTIGQWLALTVLAAWRYDARGYHIEPRTRGEDELETRLWCYASGLDPDCWRDWCACDYEALPEAEVNAYQRSLA